MTTQAAPSFDQEYARVVKAAQTANDLAHHRYLVINDCMEALKLAGIANDAPLDHLVARLAGERDEAGNKLLQAMQARDTLACQVADLLAIVGTETPIAAFDLVTTWRTEKAGYMEEIATLRAAHVAQLVTIEKLTLALDAMRQP